MSALRSCYLCSVHPEIIHQSASRCGGERHALRRIDFIKAGEWSPIPSMVHARVVCRSYCYFSTVRRSFLHTLFRPGQNLAPLLLFVTGVRSLYNTRLLELLRHVRISICQNLQLGYGCSWPSMHQFTCYAHCSSNYNYEDPTPRHFGGSAGLRPFVAGVHKPRQLPNSRLDAGQLDFESTRYR